MEFTALDRYFSISHGLSSLSEKSQRRKRRRDSVKRASKALIITLIQTTKRFAKGFSIGYVGRLLFKLLPLIIRFKHKFLALITRNPSKYIGKEPLQYGIFVGAFLAIFEAYARVVKLTKNDSSLIPMETFVSGGICGISLLFCPETSRKNISVFMLIRAFEVVYKYLRACHYIPHVRYGIESLMCASSCQVLWGYIFCREAVDSHYLNFLDKQGGQPLEVLALIPPCFHGETPAPGLIEAVNVKRLAQGLPGLSREFTFPCELIHPTTTSHFMGVVHFMRPALLRALTLYVPMYLVPLVIFRHKALAATPARVIWSTAKKIARSSVFLSLYCAVSWLGLCWFHSSDSTATLMTGVGLLSGLTVFIEKPERRTELSLYVLSHAVQCLHEALVLNRSIPRVVDLEVFVFMASTAVIMTAYVHRPELLREGYKSLLRYLLGSGQRHLKSDDAME